MDWLDLDWDRDLWDFMNVIMNVQIPYTVGNFVTIWDVLGSPGPRSVELVTLKHAFKMTYF
jgi:hypothetical protein